VSEAIDFSKMQPPDDETKEWMDAPMGPPDALDEAELPRLRALEKVIAEQGEDAVDAHLVLDAAADISSVVGEQLEEALYVLQTATQNFIAMMALMNKYHEMAYQHGGQEGDAQ